MPNGGLTCGMRGQVLLTKFSQLVLGEEKERETKEKKEKKLEREKVYLLSRFLGDRSVRSRQDKKQSWSTWQRLRVGTGIVEFRQLREVGVFSYLDIICLKSHENSFGCCEAGNGHGFRFHKVEPMLDEEGGGEGGRGCPWTAHRLI